MLQSSPQPGAFMAQLKHSLQTLLAHQPFWRIVLLLSAVAIVYLATTSEPYPIPASPSDKVNHVIAFIQLAVVARLSWPGLSRVWVAIGVMSFGLGIELIQLQLPYREFSMLDLAADGVGTAIGLLPCAFIFDAGTRRNRVQGKSQA